MPFRQDFRTALLPAALVMALAFAAPITAQAAGARPPLGLQLFCLKNVEECQASGPSTISAGTDLHSVLSQVNSHVNSSIRPRSDGRRDQWSNSTSYGDCEDYVLTKRSALIRYGVPSAALSIGVTHTRSGEPHAVLLVQTSSGHLVLDNLTSRIHLLEDTGYQIERASTTDLLQWTSTN
jgi:predicted transglutaminase-like cysteine proteinase